MKDHDATETAYRNGYADGKPKWISVKDRLPKDGDMVIIYHQRNIEICPYFWNHFIAFDANGYDYELIGVTHWMQLPEPPEENDKPLTNADRIRDMRDEEMAEFIMLSPEMEFSVCECCDVFRGHGADTPCGTEDGWCRAELRCNAFKKWLQQPAEEV